MKKPNIKFKSVLDGIKGIQKRNEYFDWLDDQGKRLETAWDSLKLVSRNVIHPSDGHYWDSILRTAVDGCEGSKQLQSALNNDKAIGGCSVCARGVIMLSIIRLGNSIAPSSDNISKGDESILKGFSLDSMKRMEREYENSYYEHPYSTNTREKLMNILCNVLVNGDFNINDKTDYLI